MITSLHSRFTLSYPSKICHHLDSTQNYATMLRSQVIHLYTYLTGSSGIRYRSLFSFKTCSSSMQARHIVPISTPRLVNLMSLTAKCGRKARGHLYLQKSDNSNRKHYGGLPSTNDYSIEGIYIKSNFLASTLLHGKSYNVNENLEIYPK
ncbi:hypothetical protein BDF20DRAFT_838107 [Mycotypha africana]|uniref:uncharacterized protein n=1 Tax=Mycotypha africana TaxID=64632 RepID=UPI002300F1AF|nr:uncharacterized protein BDF20DRAFT_838107 [Mycotypha africana]KAI8971824.1 hypothetical protein BDF20DRAFT_838107 [Mycotypha africana]